MTYSKIFKWFLAALFVVGVAAAVYGFVKGWPGTDEWKLDLAKADELTEVISGMEANGIESLTGAALEQRKEEIAAKEAELKTIKAQHDALTAEVAEMEKAKAKKKEIEAKKAEEKVILEAFDATRADIEVLKEAVTLAQRKAELEEIKAKIASSEKPVNVILFGTYLMMAIALVALFIITFVISGMNNPMSLVKLIIGIVVIGVLIGGAWMLAPGTALTEFHGDIPPTAGELKVTDTVLYLAYLFFGATIVSLIASWIVGAVRK